MRFLDGEFSWEGEGSCSLDIIELDLELMARVEASSELNFFSNKLNMVSIEESSSKRCVTRAAANYKLNFFSNESNVESI